MAENWDVIIDQRGHNTRKIYYNKLTGETTFDKPDHLKTLGELQRDSYLRKTANTDELPPLDFSDHTAPPTSSTDDAIGSSNVGFQMLQKYGWNGTKGLGKDEKGIVAPIQLKGVDSLSGGRTSTPEEEAADEAVSEVTKERRKLNIEIKQTNEMIAQKTEIAEREQLIEEELKFIHREFYCECCDKQYKNVAEMASHYDSYDHAHTKRLKDLRQADKKRAFSGAVSEEEHKRKQEKRALRDMEKRAKQMSEQLGGQSLPSSLPPQLAEQGASTSGGVTPAESSTTDAPPSSVSSNSPAVPAASLTEGNLLPLDRNPMKPVKFGMKMTFKRK